MPVNTAAIGKTFAPATYAVGREKVREYAHAVGETDALYLDVDAARAAGYADVVAPPMFAVVYSLPAVWPALFDEEVGIDFARMVHGGQAVRVGPGRRGRRRDHDDGEPQGRLRAPRQRVLRLRVGVGERARRDGLHRPVVEHRAGRLMQPGDELAPLSVTPDKYLTVRYAGASGDFNPIHIDEEFARAVGLPGRILHGLYTMAQVARAHTEAGGGPASLKRLSVQFRGMGVPEVELAVTGTVTEVRDDGVVVTESSCEQDGKRIIRNAEAELRLEP